MSSSSKKTARARRGKSLADGALRKFFTATQKQRLEVFEKLAVGYRRQAQKLFSKTELRLAAEIERAVNAEWRRASLQAKGDSRRLDRLRAAAHRKFVQRAERELPHFRPWQALRTRYLRELDRLHQAARTGAPFDRADLDWDNLPDAVSDAVEFGQPFPVVDVNTIDQFHLVSHDASFAHLDVGNLENNFAFDQDEVSFPLQGTLGLFPVRGASNQVACGVNFTLPRAGRLQLTAVLQNFFNRVTFSVRDNFGFSSAGVTINLNLFIAVVRGQRVIHLPTTLLQYGLVSEGGNLSYTLSDIDNSQPYTVTALTEETMSAGESVQILAGSEVQIGTQIDDMECHVNALLSWQLRKLIVGVI